MIDTLTFIEAAIVEVQISRSFEASEINQLCNTLRERQELYSLSYDDFLELRSMFPSEITVTRRSVTITPSITMITRVKRLNKIYRRSESVELVRTILKSK